jgi:hypothetical protein
LVLGADDELVEYSEGLDKSVLKDKYGIPRDKRIVTSGGKFDLKKKGFFSLLESIEILESNICIIIFGSIDENMKSEFDFFLSNPRVIYLGWLDSKETYEVLSLSDIVFFPSSHSVLFEISAALSKPLILQHYYNNSHIETRQNGYSNILQLNKFDKNHVKELISYYFADENFTKINKLAKEKSTEFKYSLIAKKSLLNE